VSCRQHNPTSQPSAPQHSDGPAKDQDKHPLAVNSPPLMIESINPSRIFILHPSPRDRVVVAILVVGLIAYLQLPLSALPGPLPPIQVPTFDPARPRGDRLPPHRAVGKNNSARCPG